MEVNLAGEVRNPFECFRAGPADHAVDFVALLQQEFGEVTAILTGNARNERSFHRPDLVATDGGMSTE